MYVQTCLFMVRVSLIEQRYGVIFIMPELNLVKSPSGFNKGIDRDKEENLKL